jgi:hypothetical protein
LRFARPWPEARLAQITAQAWQRSTRSALGWQALR